MSFSVCLFVCFFISDDFFDIRSSSSSTTFGLAAGLAVCIVVILGGFIVWNYSKSEMYFSLVEIFSLVLWEIVICVIS